MEKNKILKITLAVSALFGATCSLFDGPSKPEIIVDYDNLQSKGYSDSFAPQWDKSGTNIFFVGFGISKWEGVCKAGLEDESIEEIRFNKNEELGWTLAVSPISDVMAYVKVDNSVPQPRGIVMIGDLAGNARDSFLFSEPEFIFVSDLCFSRISDNILYILFAFGGEHTDLYLLRLNLQTREYDTILTSTANLVDFWMTFDIFPEDSAVLMNDSIYSLASGGIRYVDFGSYSPYAFCSINQPDPRYVAISGFEDPADTAKWADFIAVVNIIDGDVLEVPAAPRDRRDFSYDNVIDAVFSPDGNSLVYCINTYFDNDASTIIGLIREVFR